MRRILLAGLIMLLAQPTVAAQIDVLPATPDAPINIILVQGELVAGDIDQFRAKAAGLPGAVVMFRSEGGSVVAGIRIGRYIRLRNWYTFVPDGMMCASACALAWLGGTRRIAEPTASIGFHAAYTTKGGQIAETGAGNALVGNYLGELGLSEAAIFYITSADPRSMRWLSAADAAALGIELEIAPTKAKASPSPPQSAAPDRTLEQRSATYINSIMATWSNWAANWADGNEQAIRTLQNAYSSQVSYYGKLLSQQDVLADKRKFIERWPQRRYTIRAQSLAAACANRMCTITGTVDYYVTRDPTATVRSQGTAEFEYQVMWSEQGVPAIISETSKVTSRQPQQAK